MPDNEKVRMYELLREAAKEFASVSNPFETEWLRKHNVLGDECIDLSLQIAAILKTATDGPAIVQGLIAIASGGATEEIIDEFLISYCQDKIKKRLERDLKKC